MMTSVVVNSKVSTQGLSEPFPREDQVIHDQQQLYLREIWPHMLEGCVCVKHAMCGLH